MTSIRRFHGGRLAPSSARSRAGSGPPSTRRVLPSNSTRNASPCPTSSARTRTPGIVGQRTAARHLREIEREHAERGGRGTGEHERRKERDGDEIRER